MSTVTEVANRLVELCRQANYSGAVDELYASNVLSIESAGAPAERVEGIEGVREKGKQFAEMLEEHHGVEVSDPIVADNFFSVNMTLDVTMKGSGRSKMEEIAVYEVKDGKVVKEQFFYTPPPSPNE